MLDLTKPVQTRSGVPVRILCTDAKKENGPIIGLIQYKDGTESCYRWNADGRFMSPDCEHDYDLVNVPDKHVFYVNAYEHDPLLVPQRSREEADRNAAKDRIACVRVEWTEGQFDD